MHKKNYANNISQFLWEMMKGRTPAIYGDGKQTRDFTYVSDIVQANLLALKSEKTFGVYNVGTGIETSFNEIVEILNRNLNMNIRPSYVSNPIKNYVYRTQADISLAAKELGYKPDWTIDMGVKELVSTIVNKKLVSQAA